MACCDDLRAFMAQYKKVNGPFSVNDPAYLSAQQAFQKNGCTKTIQVAKGTLPTSSAPAVDANVARTAATGSSFSNLFGGTATGSSFSNLFGGTATGSHWYGIAALVFLVVGAGAVVYAARKG